VVHHTLTWYAAAARGGLVCTVNLSGTSLGGDGFLDYIVGEFRTSGVSYNSICFEITETAAVADLTTASRFITELRRHGCRFALDDFGSGMSSFGYLKNLPVDYLKIDGSFVRDMVTDPVDRAMVEAIHTIGHVMGKRTIAEWVENEDIQQELMRLGVDYAQGYAIATPQPLGR
jgi:EAL domain-containing protein (putative c-di-GMP-specific phosphodiesterase class I)